MAEGEREFLRSIFLMEAWDMVAAMEEQLQTLQGPGKPHITADHGLLMLAHKLRGAAAVQGFSRIAEIATDMEERLERAAGMRPKAVRRLGTQLQASLTSVKVELDVISATHAAPPPSVADAGDTAAVASEAVITAEALEQFFAESSDLLDYFAAEAAEHLDVMGRCILALEQGGSREEEIATLFRAVHTLKGAAYTVGCRPVGDLAHLLEDLMTAVREREVSLSPAVIDAVFAGTDALRLLLANSAGAAADLAPAVQRAVTLVQAQLPGAAPSDTVATDLAMAPRPESPDTSASTVASSSSLSPGPNGSEPDPAAAAAPPAGRRPVRSSIRVGLDRLDALMNVVGELVIARSRLDRRLGELDRVGELLTSSRVRMQRAVGDFEGKYAYQRLHQDEPGHAAGAGGVEGVFDELEFDRYDDFNILARSLAEVSADVSEVRSQLAGVIRVVRDDAAQIRRLTGEVRGEITRARMVPIGSLFARFARQVRETARDAAKRVVLEASGETVEVDNTIIEQIADPLLHLVQNAIWHGIEPELERQARQKAPQGTVYLSARHEGGSVYVEVEDDGAGIDAERLVAQAVAKDFLRPEAAAGLSRAEALNLMFLPGFSTAEAVSTGAGRGVGMDVVRTNVSRLNGEIEVETEVGVGTRFTLKLPLTVVISDALLVRVGAETLAVPLTAVRQIRSFGALAIQHVGDTEVVDVEGELLDLVRLDQRLQLASVAVGAQVPVLVLRAGGRTLAIAVNEILRKEEIVIKSLGEFLEGVGPFAGTTIGGDGRVILVLDPSRLVESRNGHRRAGETDTPTPTPRTAVPTRRGTVLLVDDSVSVRKFVGGMLERADFEVHTAIDGAEALERLGELRVDVVVTDLEMPRVNGYELIEALRRRPATRDVPVVVLTTRAGGKHVSVAERLGVRHYVTKPVDEDAFVRLLASLVSAASVGPVEPTS